MTERKLEVTLAIAMPLFAVTVGVGSFVYMSGFGKAAAIILLPLLAGGVLYVTPTIVAIVRGVPNAGSLIVVNLLLGWTFIGWVIAMAWACANVPEPQRRP